MPAPSRLAAVVALTALAGGCQTTVDSITNPFGSDVATMPGTVISTASLRKVGDGPNRLPPPAPPRTLYYSGVAGDGSVVIAETGRVIPNRQILDYLRQIVGRLMAEAPPGSPEIQVHLLGNPLYGASAHDNGDIFININALAKAVSEDELAVLLGHEIGHVLLAHHDKDKLFQERRDATNAAVLGLLVSQSLASAVKGRQGARAEGALRDTAIQVGAAKLALDFVADDVVSASWNRAQESEADLIGLDLAVKAGYDPNTISDNLAHLIEAESKRRTRVDELSTKADEGAANLEAEMNASLSQGRLDLSPVVAHGATMVAHLGTALAKDGRDFIARQYQSADERLDRANTYLIRFYPDAGGDASDAYEQQKQRLGVVPLNNAYVKIDEALQSMARKDTPGALDLIQQAYREARIDRDPFPRTVEAFARAGQGDNRRAVAALRAVPAGTPLPIEGYSLLAMLEAGSGAHRNALSTLDRAQDTYGTEATQPMRITVLSRLGRTEEARTALTDCTAFSAPTQQQCRVAAVAAGLTDAPPQAQPGTTDPQGKPDMMQNIRSLLGVGT